MYIAALARTLLGPSATPGFPVLLRSEAVPAAGRPAGVAVGGVPAGVVATGAAEKGEVGATPDAARSEIEAWSDRAERAERAERRASASEASDAQHRAEAARAAKRRAGDAARQVCVVARGLQSARGYGV